MKRLRNKGKKVVVMVLCCVICMMLFGNHTLAYDCGHQSWEIVNKNIKYTYYNSTQHRCDYHSYMYCKKCPAEVDLGQKTIYSNHVLGTPRVAACNGNTQTIHTTCTTCKGTVISKRKCPAAPHASGNCPAMTLDIKPESEIK